MAIDTSFSVRTSLASPAASTTSPHFQILAGTSPFHVMRIRISQETSVTSGAMAVEIVRSTATAAGTLTSTGVVTAALNARDPVARFAATNAGFSGVGAGTQTVIERLGFNILTSPLEFAPTPQEWPEFDVATALWIRFPLVVAATFNVSVWLDEV